MKLLLDANISYRLADRLSDLFPDSTHVSACDLARGDDLAVWNYALEQQYTIASKDEDFHQMAFVRGPPPKVVWVRLGNCSTDDIETAIRRNADLIQDFMNDETAAFLTLR